VLFKTHENFNPENLCVLPRRIFKAILWLCSPWPSYVYWRFSKHVSILQGYKKRTIFVVGKRSLAQVSRLFASFYNFAIKWEYKNVNCEQWTQRLHLTSQHTYTHIHKLIHILYIHIFGNIYWISWGIFLLRYVNFACSKFQMIQICLITKLHGVLFQTTVMNLHIIMIQPNSALGRMS